MLFGSRLLLLLCVALLAQPSHALPTDGFVLAGQSNMLGRSTQFENEKTARVTSPTPLGLASWSFRESDHSWVLANEFPCDDSQCIGTNCSYPGPNRSVEGHPQWVDQGRGTCVCNCGIQLPTKNGDSDAAHGSPWPTFAGRWMAERGREIQFVATAIGGQGLVLAPGGVGPTWDPDAMDCSTLPPIGLGLPPPSLSAAGELYCRMLEAVSLSGVTTLRAVLWQQGESDVGVTQAVYQAALERLGDRVWEDLHVPLIVAPLSRKTRGEDACEATPEMLLITNATEAAAGGHHVLLGPDLDDLVFENDCTHIYDVATLGDRWYDAVTNVLPQCLNGIDDDGDGLTDFPADPACADAMGKREKRACQDGIDNDRDGKIDFDGGASQHGGVAIAPPDRGCAVASANSEVGTCGLGAELAPLLALLRAAQRRASSSSQRA